MADMAMSCIAYHANIQEAWLKMHMCTQTVSNGWYYSHSLSSKGLTGQGNFICSTCHIYQTALHLHKLDFSLVNCASVVLNGATFHNNDC